MFFDYTHEIEIVPFARYSLLVVWTSIPRFSGFFTDDSKRARYGAYAYRRLRRPPVVSFSMSSFTNCSTSLFAVTKLDFKCFSTNRTLMIGSDRDSAILSRFRLASPATDRRQKANASIRRPLIPAVWEATAQG